MNANVDKTQFFHEIKYDFKGNSRSHKMTFYLKNYLLFVIFSFEIHRIKTFDEYQYYKDTKFSSNKV